MFIPRVRRPRAAVVAALTCAVTLGGMVAPAGALPGHARPAGEAMAASRPAAPASSSTFASRSTAAPRPIVDSAGRTWEARTVGWGTWNRSDGLAGKAIAGAVDQMLYRANAWGIKWYRLDVPAAATYTVRLHMAEDHFSAAGKRVFDVVAEGRTVARDVDIFRAVGRAAAHVVEFSVPVTDGRLDVNFVARANNPLVSAVEVVSNVPVTQVKTGGLTNVPVSPKSFWRTSVRNAPLAVNSARTVAIIAKDAKDNWGGTAGLTPITTTCQSTSLHPGSVRYESNLMIANGRVTFPTISLRVSSSSSTSPSRRTLCRPSAPTGR